MNFTLDEARAVLGDPLDDATASGSSSIRGYSIDSRTLPPGELFFAIEGEHFDGHAFVAQALEKGASAAVVVRTKLENLHVAREKLIAVDDTLAALQALAGAARSRWHGTLIGVTGSVGKTTAKEAIAQVLGARFRVLKSRGNLNNHFGLPLQLLRVQPDEQFAVLEMGMSSPGEIARLAEIALPDWGAVTVVAPVHTEFFADGIEGVARAKRELVEWLPGRGVAFLNADDARVAAFRSHTLARSVYYGRSETAQVRAEDVTSLGESGTRFTAVARGEHAVCTLPLLGEHNVTNALAAIAVGVEAGMTVEECAAALGEMAPPENRGQVIHIGGAVVINDCYNSSPRALEAMIDALAQMPSRRRILVAGEMLELGPQSAAMHEACGRYATSRGMDVVVGVRGNAEHLVRGARDAGVEALFLVDSAAAGEWMAANVREGDAVLLKASRGVRLEAALDILNQRRAET